MATKLSTKIILSLLGLIVVLTVTSFALYKTPAAVADRSFDRLEQARIERWINTADDNQIEAARLARSAKLNATESGYNLVEEVRVDRSGSFAADRTYDQIEAARFAHFPKFIDPETGYNLVENVRIGRSLSIVVDSRYDGIEDYRSYK